MNLSEKYELLAGTVSYRDLAHGAVPWFIPQLLPTETSRERLRKWVGTGGMARPLDSSVAIDRRLTFCGDEGVRAVVVRALERIAPPARDYLLDVAWVIGLGPSSNGGVELAPPLPSPSAPEALRLVILNGKLPDEDLAGIVGHECAHLWLGRMVPTGTVLEAPPETRKRRQRLVTLAAEWGQLGRIADRFADPVVREERLVAALTAAWGFRGPGADVGACVQLTRRRCLAEFASLMASSQ